MHHSASKTMSNQDFNLKSLLSPARSGTFFAPFKSRSANPDGFDSKMKLWINSIEEWVVLNKKLTICLKDIHQAFVSDTGIRPDKECIRLVLSEMKRRSKLVPLNSIKTSKFWSNSTTVPLLDNIVDPKGWFGWGVRRLVYDPANWAFSTLTSNQDPAFSDLTDMSINDTTKFVCQKSLNELSQRLLIELVRISKAEKQFCFEWQHLLEFITPIMNTIIDATDGNELLEMLDILIEYLAINKHVAIQTDNESKLVKIANTEDSKEDEVTITKKDVAMARLLRAKELLTADADKYHSQAQRAKHNAVASFKKQEVAKAKSLLRSHKRLQTLADQKEMQLSNVEVMLEQLETTDSNMMILKAYKDGADALRIANTNLDSNTSILDEVYDATAEASQLNNEMNQMMKDISYLSQPADDTLNADLTTELDRLLNTDDKDLATNRTLTTGPNSSLVQNQSPVDDKFVDELEQRLNSLVVCQDDPDDREQSPRKKTPVPAEAT